MSMDLVFVLKWVKSVIRYALYVSISLYLKDSETLDIIINSNEQFRNTFFCF